MNVFLRDIRVIDPASAASVEDPSSLQTENVLIAAGRIAERGQEAQPPANAMVLDCAGKYMLPGLCDMRVFVGEPGNEQRETMQQTLASAANAGITTVLCMPDCDPALDSVAAVRYIKSLATHPLVSAVPSACITRGFDDVNLAPMLELLHEGVKVFTNGALPLQSAETLRRAMAYIGPIGGVISDFPLELSLAHKAQMHAGAVAQELGMTGFPAAAEQLGIARAVWLANVCGAATHIPGVSCAASIDFLRQARAGAARFTAECSVLNLTKTDAEVRSFNTALKQLPPLRTADDNAALWHGLQDGTIDCVSSNHRAAALHEKDVEFDIAAFGSRNLELLLPLLWTEGVAAGKLSLERFVQVSSSNPRRILGLEEINFGPGAEANFTIITTDSAEMASMPAVSSDFAMEDLAARARYTYSNSALWDCSQGAEYS